jgi:hypothetical protein
LFFLPIGLVNGLVLSNHHQRTRKEKKMRKGLFIMAAVLLVCSPPGFCQQPGDVYLWEFNEGSGSSVTDNSGEFTASMGLVVTPESIPSTRTDSPSGKAGDRALVPGGGLYVDDAATALDITEGPITLEAWFKMEALNQYQDILSYGDTYKIGINNGYVVWTFRTVEDTLSEIPLDADNTWHHVAMAWEPGVGVSFYFDGALASYAETTSLFRAPVQNVLFIGSGYNGGSPLPGLLDRVRIHNALLDETQLDSDAANPKAPLTSTLASFNFDETALPFSSSVGGVDLSGIAWTEVRSEVTRAAFSPESPTGEANDFSLYFDGNDRVTFVDEMDIMQFVDEDFTFEVWIKFNAAEQLVPRPVLFAYGIGGQNGYSFSFRNFIPPLAQDISPSGKAGDRSIKVNGGLSVDDSTNPVLAIGAGPMTIEAWVKADNVSGAQDFVRYGNSFKVGFNNGNLLFTALGVSDVYAGVNLTVDGLWHHVAYAWEPGSGITYYLDGVEVAFTEFTGTNRDLQNNLLAIGSSHTGTSPFQGSLDRVRIHNAVLTASQLDSDPANPKTPLANTIVAYDFDEGGVPYTNAASANRPAVDRAPGSTVSVTTFGILDAHSEAAIPDDGQWHHIAAAHEMGVEFRFFVDGKLMQQRPYTDGVRFAEVYDFLIGSEASGGNPFVGYLDRVKITRAALNEGELDYFEPVGISDWSLF